jgi:hypothetical protein
MRFFETAPLKALLTPLVPVAAIGIVALATTFSPPAPPISTTSHMTCVERVPSFTQVSPPPPPTVRAPLLVPPLSVSSK